MFRWIACLGMGFLLACAGGSPLTKSKEKPEGESGAPEGDDDPLVAEAVPISLFDGLFLTTLDSLFSNAIIDPDHQSGNSGPDVIDLVEPGLVFDYSATIGRPVLILSEHRWIVTYTTEQMDAIFGDGGFLGPEKRIPIRLVNGKGQGVFRLAHSMGDGPDKGESYVVLDVDAADRGRCSLDFFERDALKGLKWSMGILLQRDAATDAYTLTVRYGARPLKPPSGGPPPAVVIPPGTAGLPSPPTEGPPSLPGKPPEAPGSIDMSLHTVIAEVHLDPARRRARIRTSAAAYEPGGAQPFREVSVLAFDDAMIRVVSAGTSPDDHPKRRVPWVAAFDHRSIGDAVLYDVRGSRSDETVSVVDAAFFDSATLKSRAADLSSQDFVGRSLDSYGAATIGPSLRDPAWTPDCATIGSALKTAFAAFPPPPGHEQEHQASAALVNAVPDSICAATAEEATLAAVKAACKFTAFDVKIRMTTSHSASASLVEVGLCSKIYVGVVAKLQNHLIFKTEGGKRNQRLSSNDVIYDGAGATPAHQALIDSALEVDWSGLSSLSQVEPVFARPTAEFDPAAAKAVR